VCASKPASRIVLIATSRPGLSRPWWFNAGSLRKRWKVSKTFTSCARVSSCHLTSSATYTECGVLKLREIQAMSCVTRA
jgi:transposase